MYASWLLIPSAGKSTWIASNYHRGLERMRAEFGADRLRCYGVYRGARRARWNDIEILPVMDFLRHLWDGDILD